MEVIKVPPDVKARLTSFNLAHGGWSSARALLSDLSERNLSPDYGLFEGMLAGACVLYARPFKKAKGLVVLDELKVFDGLPNAKDLTEIHATAIDARDTVLAHQDVSRWPALLSGFPGARPVDETVVTFNGGPIMVEHGGLLPPPNLHTLLAELIKVQLRRVDSLRFGLIASMVPPNFSVPAVFQIESDFHC